MRDFFNVLGLHVWDVPDIAWVFPFGVSAEFTLVLTLVMAFTGILLRNAYSVKVEVITVALRKPQNSFVPSTEPSCTVKAVPKAPYNAIAEDHFAVAPHDIEHQIVESGAPITFDVRPLLPTNATAITCDSHNLRQYTDMFCDEVINRVRVFVFLAHAVRRRC